ncbi:hypothetical protein ACWGS9_34875, partial [Bradyrhizobium sp. Arg314]
MPRNSSGIFTPPPGTAAVSNTTIGSAPYNALVADVGNELTNSLPTTGVKAMGANLPMGSNRITGMADPIASTDGATRNYVDTTTAPIAFGTRFVGGTTTGSANAQILAGTTPNTFALTAGNTVVCTPGFTPTGGTTLQVGATAATNVLKRSPTGPIALAGGEFVANQETSFTFDGTQFLLNEPSGNILLPTLLTDSGPFELTGAISPAPSGTANDWAPSGIQTAAVIRANLGGAFTITGIAAPTSNNGRVLILENVSASSAMTLLPENTSSAAANRLTLPAPVVLSPAMSAVLIYDTATSRWRLANPVTAAPPAVARKNLKIVTTSVTAGTITADELILEDSLGMTYRATSVNVSYATGTSGANGLDTGSITASNWYFEWVIYNASTNTLASLLSLSAAAPTMPSGYTFKARVGASYFDAGSKLRFKIQY